MSVFSKLFGAKSNKSNEVPTESFVNKDIVSLMFAFEEKVINSEELEQVKNNLEEGQKLTVESLVSMFSDSLGVETKNIKSFKVNGVIVDRETEVKLGDKVKIYITGESKG